MTYSLLHEQQLCYNFCFIWQISCYVPIVCARF